MGDARLVVLPADHFAVAIEPGERCAIRQIDVEVHDGAAAAKALVDAMQQLIAMMRRTNSNAELIAQMKRSA